MKRFLIGLFFLNLLFSGCSKDTESQIIGKWQLRQVTYLDKEERSDSSFFNFHLNVFKIQTVIQKENYSINSWGTYNINNDSLFIDLKQIDDLNNLSSYPIYGWHTLSKKYKINELNASKLILSCNDTIYHFRKF